MGVPSMPELLIILAIVVLLFGAKKIPDLASGMGKGIKNFKKAMKDDESSEEKIASSQENKIEENTSIKTEKKEETKV